MPETIARIRKIVVVLKERLEEAGRPVAPPTRRARARHPGGGGAELRQGRLGGRGRAALTTVPCWLDEQVGLILRQAAQRHAAVFASGIGCDLTLTQWAALAKLQEAGPMSQNRLGRATAMDAETIKGVVDRLTRRGLLTAEPDAADGRRLVALTAGGGEWVRRLLPHAHAITAETLAPLAPDGRRALVSLLLRLR